MRRCGRHRAGSNWDVQIRRTYHPCTLQLRQPMLQQPQPFLHRVQPHRRQFRPRARRQLRTARHVLLIFAASLNPPIHVLQHPVPHRLSVAGRPHPSLFVAVRASQRLAQTLGNVPVSRALYVCPKLGEPLDLVTCRPVAAARTNHGPTSRSRRGTSTATSSSARPPATTPPSPAGQKCGRRRG